ncbi:MAG: RidA family protein [Planctomycetaceae bacterium]|nr:RidA family protein [Planctomycetaceae bacterium]
MSSIQRIGSHPRWSDIVIHANTARWVEVAADLSTDFSQQVKQVFSQIDETLAELGSQKSDVLQIQIFVANLEAITELNRQWDKWVQAGQAPVRACLQAGMAGNCLVEMLITAAV